MSVTEAENKKIIIIDSNSVIHRAYHALPPLRMKSGELVNAVYGFLLVFFRAIKDFHPDFIVAAFDFPAPTFRHKKYKAYKAKRPPAPEDLYAQIPRVKEFLKSMLEKKIVQALLVPVELKGKITIALGRQQDVEKRHIGRCCQRDKPKE